MSELNINRKKFEPGSIVWYIKSKPYYAIRYGMYDVAWGIVEENYPGTVILQLYELLDTRRVNGVPIKELKTPSKWHKLPKGWTYNMPLFEITWDSYPRDPAQYSVSNADDLLAAIKDGVLVKVQDNDDAHIETMIDKENGWRIVRRYPIDEYHPAMITLNCNKVYATYDEAKKVIDDIEAERKRQAELSDYDWSVEQIDKDLNRWAKLYSIPEDIKLKYREWILERDRVEDIETRVAEGEFQWKYDKNSRWKCINL